MRLLQWILIFPLLVGAAYANEVLVNTQDGQTYVVDVDPDESLNVIQEQITALTECDAFIIAVSPLNRMWEILASSKRGGYLGYPRDYSTPVTQQERDSIHFIVATLAENASDIKGLVKLGLKKTALEAAGDKIEHVHPLRFLMTVFTDEEMKVGIRNIRGSSWVWSEFVSPLKNSLSTETRIDNMKDECIAHFAQTLEIDFNMIYPSITAQNWEGFIDILIREVPRKGDYDRYDN